MAASAASAPSFSTTRSARAAFSSTGSCAASRASASASERPSRRRSRSTLERGGGPDHHHRVERRVQADLVQERRVVEHERVPLAREPPRLREHGLADGRVGDGLELPARGRVGEDAVRHALAIEGAVRAQHLPAEGADDLFERRGARLDHRAGEHVGVDHRRAARAQQGREGALPRGDAAGQADDAHGELSAHRRGGAAGVAAAGAAEGRGRAGAACAFAEAKESASTLPSLPK